MPSRDTADVVHDAERLAALRATNLLDTEPEESFDRLTKLASRLIDAPVVLMSLVDADRQFFKSAVGLSEPWASRRETPLSHSFCKHVLGREKPLVIRDARRDSLVSENRAITELEVVAYAGAPLRTHSGQYLGSLCVIDSKPRTWTREEVELLEELAALVMTEVELREAALAAIRLKERVEREHREKDLLLEATDEGIFGVDDAGRFLFVNRSAANMLGYEVDELEGRNVHETIHYRRAGGTARPDGESLLQRGLDAGASYREDADVFWTKDGAALPVRYAVSPLPLGDDAVGVVVTFNDVSERNLVMRRLRVQHAVSSTLATTRAFHEAAPRLLEVIGEALYWKTGAVWTTDPSGERLACIAAWQVDGADLSPFIEATRNLQLARGEGLPGKAWANAGPAWSADVAEDPTFLRAEQAARSGLHSGVAFPVLSGSEAHGVVEFYSDAIDRPDEEILDTLATLGRQIGQFLERERAEAAMRETEVRKAAIMETALDSIISIDHNGTVLEWNSAAERTFGYTRAEAMHREMANLIIPPALRERHREGIRHYVETGEGPVLNQRIELTAIRADGTEFPVELAIVPLPTDGLPTFTGTIRDITARKRAEADLLRERERFKKLIEAIPQQVWTAHPDGTLEYLNQRALDYFDAAPDELIGRRWDDIAHEADVAKVQNRWKDALRSGETYEVEFRVRRAADGEFRWHLGRAIPLRDAEGQIYRWFGTNTDITERKQTELNLSRAMREAEAANKAKSQFVANMSHELRTPLNAVIGYSEMLQEEAEEIGQGGFVRELGKIRSAGKQLLALINDVLDLSKIEAGKMDLFPERFDVADVVRDVARTTEPLMKRNGNTLELACAPDLGSMYSDVTKVRQALFNLLSNAAKFTENGRVVLSVTREVQAGEDQLVFRVEDTGIGMDTEQITRLFQTFSQVHSSGRRKYGGTGLGLAITWHLCRMLGGNVEVTSEPNVGSVFTIRLAAELFPAGAGTPPEEALPAPVADLDDEPLDSGSGPLVLVIDDDADSRTLMTRFLQKEGFRVETAANGQDGLRLARTLRPLVITTDILMPSMDGWEVLSAVKSDPDLADTPVIMVTIVDNKQMAFALGATEYMTKPIDKNRLATVLGRLCQERGGCSVLLVEDDPATREVVSHALANSDYRVREAVNGREALDRMHEDEPDIILLDLMMPEMDGFAFVEELRTRERWRRIPVIVITAKDLTAQERNRLNGCVQQILQKGQYDRHALLEEICAHVKNCGERAQSMQSTDD